MVATRRLEAGHLGERNLAHIVVNLGLATIRVQQLPVEERRFQLIILLYALPNRMLQRRLC